MAERLEQLVEMRFEASEASLDQPFASIVASMVFGALVFLAMATTPIILGGLVDAGRLTNQALGLVATLEMLGIAIGSTIRHGLLRGGYFRSKIVVCCLLIAVLNWLCMRAVGGGQVGALRGACGLLEGLVLGAANLILCYTRRPEAMNGYFLGIGSAPCIAATYFLSSYAIPRFGANSGFILMVVVAGLGALAALGASGETIPKPSARSSSRSRWSTFGVASLATVILQNAGVGAAYSYLAQIAKQHGLSDFVIGASIAGLNTIAVAGSFAVGIFAWRLRQAVVLTLGCLIQAAVVVAIARGHGVLVYAVASGLFGLFWNGLIPFSFKLMIELDPSRRLALLNSPATLAGVGVGPFVASWYVSNTDVAPALYVAAMMFAVSAVLYLLINYLSRSLRQPVVR
jgi:hypothetical protein